MMYHRKHHQPENIMFYRYFIGFLVGFIVGYLAPVATYSEAPKQQKKQVVVKTEVHAVSEWMVKNSSYGLTKQEALEIATVAYTEAKRQGVDPRMILAIMRTESTFRKNVKSYAGALGVMQVIPKWHPDKGITKENGFDLKTNVSAGVAVYKEYLNKHNDIEKALLQYNGALNIPNAPYANKVLDHYTNLNLYLTT